MPHNEMGGRVPGSERVSRTTQLRRQMEQERARAAARRNRQRWLVLGSLAAVLLAVVLAIAYFASRGSAPTQNALAGVQTFSGLTRGHSSDPVTYPQTPPVGGVHAPVWQNCGFYSSPIENGNGVHSLEHGAVWITYRPDLPSDQVDALRRLTRSQTFVLVTPYPNLPTPVVATAWGVQLRGNSASDPALTQFVRKYRQGPQTPEPGAVCTGGLGTPE